jgi:hypothetical protein
VKHRHSDDAKLVLQKSVDDVASGALFDGVRLNDGKSALNGFHKLAILLWAPGLLPLGSRYWASAVAFSSWPLAFSAQN